MKRTIFLLLILSSALFSHAVNPLPKVIPTLKEWVGKEGNLELKKSARIILSAENEAELRKAAAILQQDLREFTGYTHIIITGKPKSGDIYLALSESAPALGAEGYTLTIDKVVNITAPTYKGIFWGTRTLLQLIEQDPARRFLPNGIATDYPDYEVRGFMLDCGRKFFTMDFLRDYVKLMAYYKMNNFHIHLNDNGFKKYFNENWDETYSAFRLECETYPELTAKDGSYTKKEFIELQQLANDYGITIIPEIDVPAHSLAFAKVFPEIGSKEYGMDHLDLYNPKTYEVVENVFKEYLQGSNPVFINKEVHIGTDEYNKKEAEAFRKFTDHFIKYVQGFGKDVRVWGALTHAQGTTPVTSDRVTMNAWYNGYADPVEMKKLGYKLISTPDGYLYIVPAAGYYYDYLNLPFLFEKWEPINIGKVTFEKGDTAVRGGMFAVWNDIVGNGVTMKDVNDRVFPAMQVLSQKMWAGTVDGLTYDAFKKTANITGEGPGLNIRSKQEGDANGLVYTELFNKKLYKTLNVSQKDGALWLKGGTSYAATHFTEIGYDYTVSFRVFPEELKPGTVLFSSQNAKIQISDNGKLAFSREGYMDEFDYELPLNTWTKITICGTAKGTSLYVNGELKSKLYDGVINYPNVEKPIRKMQTVFFPLQYIGDKQQSFKGGIDDLIIYNKVLDDEAVRNL